MNNPTRRNRNIGTSKQGHGQDNRQTVQHGLNVEYKADQYPLGDSSVTVLQEAVLPGFAYYVNPEQVVHVLKKLGRDANGISYIVFFQPTRKQSKLEPTWAEYKPRFEYRGKYGPAILMSAININEAITWPTSLSNNAKRELELLREEGHVIHMGVREFMIRSTPASIVATQLGRSIIHEVGHHVYDQLELHSPTSEEFADSYARNNK